MGGDVMGRIAAVDDLVTKRICDAAERGNTRECSAILADVAPRTMRDWIRWGRDGREPYMSFLAALEKAERKAEDGAVQGIRAGSERWQSLAWWLERRRRNTWRAPARPVEERQDTDYSQLTDAQLEEGLRAAQELRKKAANG